MSKPEIKPEITPRSEIHYSRVREKYTFQHLIKDDSGSWKIRVDKTIEGMDSLLGEWKTLRVETIYEPLERHGLLKSITFDVIFQRTTTDRESVLDLTGYFVQKLKFEIPNLKMYADVFVSIERGNVFIHKLPNFIQAMTLNFSEDAEFGEFFAKIGEPQKLTPKQAFALMKKSDVLSLYEETSDGFGNKILGDIRVSARG